MEEERWGDARDWENWREREAAIIAQDICARNYGHWPVSIVEWQEAAARYGLTLHIVTDDISEPAVTVGTTVVVRHTNRMGILQKRICHEIAEAVARRDGAPRPFNFDSLADEHHNVARLVEGGIASYARRRNAGHPQAPIVATGETGQTAATSAALQEELQAEDERLEAAEAQLDQ